MTPNLTSGYPITQSSFIPPYGDCFGFTIYDQLRRQGMNFPQTIMNLDPHQIRNLGCDNFIEMNRVGHPYAIGAVALMIDEFTEKKKFFNLDDYIEEQRQPGLEMRKQF